MEDAIVLYGSTGIVLLLNIVLFSNRRRLGLYSLLIQLIYVLFFLYGLLFLAEGWDRLTWWFFFLAVNCLHLLVDICLLIYLFVVNRKVVRKPSEKSGIKNAV